ncbi:TPA: SAM-dependent methyltransferase, partial [Candidatus Azambacteria bacterium]|nr:SAM-dependent methyltransferase [Candidatus Azambacteria bacterium]
MQNVFTDIYTKRFWFGGSGSGSLVENTVSYRNFLETFISDNEIKTVLDFGCGDWQFS